MADWILAFTTVIGAGIYLRATYNLPQLLVGDAVGPQFFPGLVGVGLLASGLLLMFEAWRKQAAGVVAVQPPHTSNTRTVKWILLGAAAWTALYYAMFEPAGYIVATLIYIFALLSYFNRGRWWLNAIYTASFTAIAYVLFAHFLNVALPAGVLQG